MMARVVRPIAVLVTLITVAALPVVAQGRGGGRPGGRSPGGRMGRGAGRATGRLGMPTTLSESTLLVLLNTFLTPTDDQKQQLHTIVDAAVAAAAPIAVKLAASKEEMFAAAKAGQSNDAIERIAGDQSAAASQL